MVEALLEMGVGIRKTLYTNYGRNLLCDLASGKGFSKMSTLLNFSLDKEACQWGVAA